MDTEELKIIETETEPETEIETNKATDILATPIDKAKKEKNEEIKKLSYIATTIVADGIRKINNNIPSIAELYDKNTTEERKQQIKIATQLNYELASSKQDSLALITDKINNHINKDFSVSIDKVVLEEIGKSKSYRQVVDFADILKNQVLNDSWKGKTKIDKITITPTTIRNYGLVKNYQGAMKVIELTEKYFEAHRFIIKGKDKDGKNIKAETKISPFIIVNISKEQEDGKYKKISYTYTPNPIYPWEIEFKQFIDIPDYFLKSYFGIKRDIVYIAFRNLRIQYDNEDFKETGKVKISIDEIAVKTGLKSDKTTTIKGTLIKKIMKEIEEIQKDEKNTYIELDTSKVKTNKRKDFLDSYLYIKLKPGYTNNWIQKNQKQIEETKSKDTKKGEETKQ